MTRCTPTPKKTKEKDKKKEEELRNTGRRKIEKKTKKKIRGTPIQEKKPKVQQNIREMMERFEEVKKEKEIIEKETRVKKIVKDWNDRGGRKVDVRAGGGRMEQSATSQIADQLPASKIADEKLIILRKIPIPRNFNLETNPPKEKVGEMGMGSEEEPSNNRDLVGGLKIARRREGL